MENLEKKLVFDLIPSKTNGRNSEGSFLRTAGGEILFAYSRYNTAEWFDHASCDIALIRSRDEGETWSEPVIIASAAEDFGVKNVMSVSALPRTDGSACFYFLVKENDGATSIGRAVSTDGELFTASRCRCNFPHGYYVINNDRFVRLRDGSIAVPAAKHDTTISGNAYINGDNAYFFEDSAVLCCLVSEDDGDTFSDAPARVMLSSGTNGKAKLQEPGLLELPGGVIWIWARSEMGFQYQCFSLDNMENFTPPEPSVFTSPCSPMEVMDAGNGVLYAVYNPVPNYNGRDCAASWGRTPLVLRKSTDYGKHWGKLYTIEDDPERGYCYPAMLPVGDNQMLCAYCRGGAPDGCTLNRLGIMKFSLKNVE